MKLDDKIIARSNAVELINFFLRDRTRMLDGFAEFMEILDKKKIYTKFCKKYWWVRKLCLLDLCLKMKIAFQDYFAEFFTVQFWSKRKGLLPKKPRKFFTRNLKSKKLAGNHVTLTLCHCHDWEFVTNVILNVFFVYKTMFAFRDT